MRRKREFDVVLWRSQSTDKELIKHDLAMLFCKKFITLECLVKFLCSNTSSASDDFVKACAKFRLTCKTVYESCPQQNDLWRAAFYVQDKEKFEKTHGNLPLPIKGIVVPASKKQSCGTDDGHDCPREKPPKMNYPELFVYPSLRGGLGVYTVGPLAKNVYITECGGRVLSFEDAQLLKKTGQHTQLVTLNAMFLFLDGRRTDEFDVEHYAKHGMVSFWNRLTM